MVNILKEREECRQLVLLRGAREDSINQSSRAGDKEHINLTALRGGGGKSCVKRAT